MKELKKLLNYDGPITYGEGKTLLTLPPDIHTWIMLKVGSKWRRGDFILGKLRIMMESKFIISDTVLMQKPRTPTLTDRRDEIEAETRKLKKAAKSKRREKILKELTDEEKEEWEKQERLEKYQLEKAAAKLDLASEMKKKLEERRRIIDAPDPPPTTPS